MSHLTKYLVAGNLIVCLLLAGCLSPHYPHAQQILTQLHQQGIEFKVDAPAFAVNSPLFPHELFTSLLFPYVRWQKALNVPPDVLFVYIAHTIDQADDAQSRIEDYAHALYGLSGVDLPPGSVLYYRCDEVIVVYGAWGRLGVDPGVDKALTDMCGPAFVRYPPEK